MATAEPPCPSKTPKKAGASSPSMLVIELPAGCSGAVLFLAPLAAPGGRDRWSEWASSMPVQWETNSSDQQRCHMVGFRRSAEKSRIKLKGTMTPSSVPCKSSLDRLHVAYAPVRSRIPRSLPNPDGRSFSLPRRFPRPISRPRLAVPVQGGRPHPYPTGHPIVSSDPSGIPANFAPLSPFRPVTPLETARSIPEQDTY